MFGVVKFDNTPSTSPESNENRQNVQFINQFDGPQIHPPMLRRSHTKSRNGCTNCKQVSCSLIRRLKCDESKPSCIKCTKSRKSTLVCEYPSNAENEPVPLVRNRYSRIVPRIKEPFIEGTSPVSLVEPVQALFKNQTDAQYFNLFLTKTSRNLSGCFDDDIWNRLILQSCQEEEFTRHAVVAIAALHKTASSDPQTKNDHHTYALQKYAGALKLMRESLSDVDTLRTNEFQLRRTLISSLLTTCFEAFHGNHTASISQASSAIRLLHSSASTSALQTGNSTIDRDLLSIFARLETIALTITQQEIVPQDNTPKGLSDDHLLSSIPHAFQTLREARFYWDIFVRRSQSWRASYGFKFYHPPATPNSKPPRRFTTSHGPDFTAVMALYNNDFEAAIRTPIAPHRLPRLEEQMSTYYRSLSEWSMAFTPLFEKLRAGDQNSVEYYGVTLLMISLLSHGVNNAIKRPKTEDTFSSHMFTLIKEILAWEKSRRDPEEADETVFLFDAGLLLHLFIAATRSHDREVRREALQILKGCKRREGLVDSAFCYKIGLWLEGMDYEVDRTTGEVGRRKARLVVTDEEFDFEGRRVRVRCRRIDREGVVFTPVLTLAW